MYCFAAGRKDCCSSRRGPEIFSRAAACSCRIGRQHAESMHRECSARNLSPGGCADLLAAAWFVHQLQSRVAMSLAILCSGQGAQHPAMLDMIADHPAAAEVIKTGEAALGVNLRDVLTQSDKMFRNAIAQPLICLTQLALWTALRPDTPKPAAFCGYSVGELGAYACAGALDAAGLARIAAARAALMDEAAAAAAPGGMLALQGLRRAKWIACVPVSVPGSRSRSARGIHHRRRE